MKIGVLKEKRSGETRVALTPNVVQNLIKMGFEVLVETQAGVNAHYPDATYSEAGATVGSRKEVLNADVMVQVNIPDAETLGSFPRKKYGYPLYTTAIIRN